MEGSLTRMLGKIIKACVASTNPVKVGSAKVALEKMFPGCTIQVEGKSTESGVPDQPMSDDETYQGAVNRAKAARHSTPGCDLYFGIEGGLEERREQLVCFAWIVVLRGEGADGPSQGESRTSTFALPPAVTKLVKGGMELGKADDEVFGRKDSGKKNGTVGHLTKGLIGRQEYYEQAAALALIPFVNHEWYT